MQIPLVEIVGPDAKAARLMCGLTCRQLAALAEVSEASVLRLEAGLTVQLRTRTSILQTLANLGARFCGRSDIRHTDGRVAPTKRALGALHGWRLSKARRQLRLSIERLASLTGVSIATLTRMEAADHLEAAPTREFYAVVGCLQLSGYAFGPSRHGGISGDVLVVVPPKPKRERKGPSRYHTKGVAVYHGIPQKLLKGLELEFIQREEEARTSSASD